MTSVRRAAALLAVLLTVLIAGGTTAAAAPAAGARADRVLVVGVPGLVWSDLDPEATPNLWALAEDAPISAVSVRAARATSCLLDGWATLGAGNRARFPAPDEAIPPVPLPTVPLPGEAPGTDGEPAEPEAGPADDAVPEEEQAPAVPPVAPSLSHCGLQERLAAAGLADPQSAVAAVAADRGTARFGAEPAALGAAVGCATVVGRAPALAVAAPGVELTQRERLPPDPGLVAEILTGCPLTLVSLDPLVDAGQADLESSDTGTEPQPRAAAVDAIDAAVGRLTDAVDAVPGETLLLLQGVSEVNDGRPQLHVGIASGPGFDEAAWLSSASTGRAPFTQLIDVAPTALTALGLDVPASMNGQPLRVAGERPPLAEAVDVLDRANTTATVHHRSTGAFFWGLVAVTAAVVGLGLVVAGGRRRNRAPRPAGEWLRGAVRPVALGAAALPVATYLAGLLPWERTGGEGGRAQLALAGSVLLTAAAVTAVAALGPWRTSRLGPPAAVLTITLATLVGDVLTGSSLELGGLLGYDAIVAGRFTGYGNLSFGLLAVSSLLLTAFAAAAAGRRAPAARARAVVAGTVLGAGALLVLVIGAPGLGRDFGGVLAALPGFLLLAMLLTRTRVTLTRLAAVLATAVVAVGTLAVLDWLRPPGDRSHLGRFVEQVLTGEAWTVVSRKAQANLDILLGSPLAWMLPVALVAAVWLVRPAGGRWGGWVQRLLPAPLRGPGLLRGRSDLLAADDLATLRAGLLAVALSLAVGAAVNDSGVALPATAAALLVPLLVWLAAAPRTAGRAGTEEADGTPGPDPVEGPDRVTVVSRGSTVWNA
ncbi:hypothetical protein [Geodermatophilus sabuli]|uniref:Uncharacterized protein n=1 Tax=Geodermatophilus sabuli TaxID=1564158 RepID=A0A285EDZ4_9ACTN|nr:hypothetical protein [Geodermatophilus sabuli]MBB3084739.1 hypothetical protein [Geodermatophilus sabuli]SNX97073.1 hypothetical protein SAMN06893097_10622 [Geodermatophilus sabuli]